MLTEIANRFEWLKNAIEFVYPPRCLGCDDYLAGSPDICDRCLSVSENITAPICLKCAEQYPSEGDCLICKKDGLPLFAFGDYARPLTEIIIQFKFQGITSPAEILAAKLWTRFAAPIANLKPDMLVPVPLHPSRHNVRGYNQASLFANALSVLSEICVNEDIAVRTKRRKPQARLEQKHREKNIEGVFEVDQAPETNARVIIVDDVVTSGSTMRELARVLSEARYTVVGGIAMAYGHGHS